MRAFVLALAVASVALAGNNSGVHDRHDHTLQCGDVTLVCPEAEGEITKEDLALLVQQAVTLGCPAQPAPTPVEAEKLVACRLQGNGTLRCHKRKLLVPLSQVP